MKNIKTYEKFLLEQSTTKAAPLPTPTVAPSKAKTPDGAGSNNKPSTPNTTEPKTEPDFKSGEKNISNDARKSIVDIVDPGIVKKVGTEIDNELKTLLTTTIKQSESVLLAAGIALAFPKFVDIFGNFIQKIRNWVRELFGKEKLTDKNAITKFGEWLHKKMMGGLTSIINAIARMFKITLKEKTAEHIAHAIIWIAIGFLCAGGLVGVSHAIQGLEFGKIVTELLPTITKAYEIVLAAMAIILYVKYKEHIKDGIKHLLHYIEELWEDKGVNKKFHVIKEHVIKKYNIPTRAPKETTPAPSV